MAAVPLTGNALHKAEMEYLGNFGNTLGMIQHISLIIIVDVFYATCHLATQTAAPNIPGFQSINHSVCILLVTHINPYFIFLIIMMAQMSSYLHGVVIKLKTTQPIIVYDYINTWIMQ